MVSGSLRVVYGMRSSASCRYVPEEKAVVETQDLADNSVSSQSW